MISHSLPLSAILRRKYRIPSELRSQAVQGPVLTRVGDRLGTPSGSDSFWGSLLFDLLNFNFVPFMSSHGHRILTLFSPFRDFRGILFRLDHMASPPFP